MHIQNPSNLIGCIFGDYKVIEYLGKIKNNRFHYFKLKCTICGEERISPKTKKNGFDGKLNHNNKVCIEYLGI